MKLKRSLLIGAAVATTALGGIGAIGVASAATNSATTGSSSIVDKIASKFNLNKSDVQAVFNEDRTTRQADMAAKQKERLAQAVTDGKLTQAQADYITKAQAEIASLRGTTKPGEESDTTREQIKTKTEALRKWATDNKIDLKYVMGGGMRGHSGPMNRDTEKTTSDTTSSTSN